MYDDHGRLVNGGALELTKFKKWKNGLTDVYICDKEAERRKEKVACQIFGTSLVLMHTQMDDSARRFLPCTIKMTVRHVDVAAEKLPGIVDTTLNPVKPASQKAQVRCATDISARQSNVALT